MTLIHLAISLVLTAEPAPLDLPRRVAVLVGANEAPAGRPKLRFAHRDAERVRAALVSVGNVAFDDAHLLLDPSPAEVLRVLSEVAGALATERRETVLYFYYSGHADERSLFPNGEPLSTSALRAALLDGSATVRIGIIDACRGGSWTRAKGLTSGPPIDLRAPLTLASEGTVLIASSSGLEEAHESDALKGSFFTHHLVGGLLGAADASGDGQVSATEVFQYAQAQTVRDSARASLEPQHPSFEWNLHGRRDLVLARLEGERSTLAVEQSTGPLQVVELPSGLVLLELPEGQRHARLAVPAGDYLVRRIDDRVVTTAKEVRVVAGKTTLVSESSLELVGRSALDAKSAEVVFDIRRSVLAAHTMAAGVSAGLASASGTLPFSARLFFAWSPIERLEVSFLMPGVTLQLGPAQEAETLLSAGLEAVGFSNEEPLIVRSGVAVGHRRWFGSDTAVYAGARFSNLISSSRVAGAITGSVVLSHTFSKRVTVNFGVSAAGWPGVFGGFAGFSVGSTLVGVRTLPLVQVHLTPRWTLVLDSQVTGFGVAGFSQRHLMGAAFQW
jgi:hypothetical protein